MVQLSKTIEAAVAKRSEAMETETISKTGTGLMSSIQKIFFVLLSVCIVFSGCDKDDDDKVVDVATFINAKWEISDPNSAYSSFEFNKDGNYIVVENVSGSNKSAGLKRIQSTYSKVRASSESNLSPIHFGNYKIEENKIILSGFGTINVISITAEEFSFSFVLESTGKEWTFVANKTTEPISTSSRTEMLCRTWTINKISIDETLISEEEKNYYIEEYGSNWKVQIEKEYTDEMAGLVILFSKAGTYLVLYTGEESEAGLAEWKWANTQETAIYYSWDNWQEADWGGDWQDNIVQIKELSNTILKMQEEELIYELTLSK